MNKVKDKMTEKVQRIINFELGRDIKSPIFVFIGIDSYIHIDAFKEHIADVESFSKNGNEELFNKEWFSRIFSTLLNTANDYYVLSFQQYSYLIYYLNSIFIEDRIIIVKDTLRMLFPINGTYDYSLAVCEERHENMPDYMAELLRINNKSFYTIKAPSEKTASVSLIGNDEKTALQPLSEECGYELIDIVNDPYGLDLFINQCLEQNDFHKKVLVKVHVKHPQDQKIKSILEQLNFLLHLFGGELYEYTEWTSKEDIYEPTPEILALFHNYWGDNANFRKINVYKNPDYEKTVISISQGQIVETIIDEYKKTKEGKRAKDLFLTAPTGAGKSLLFQLPAFYVSQYGDVTIVVSPLIALMKDQVNQIRTERGFLNAAYINGELSLIDRDRVIDECKKGEIDILYMAPELLLSYDINFFIGKRKLGLMVIDEAHLITTWGRDFRVDYWFLGLHINKMRKYLDYSFPMVAVTATAIYGGDNDMVFDSINSLYMNDPHIYIGEVKRSDISFVIDNHDKYKSNYDAEKEKETVQFIKEAHKLGIKTIVYAPYTSHINKIQQRLEADGCQDIAVLYYGSLPSNIKEYAYDRFRNNDCKIMISTKAFGMGVDISDIQLVYHHAPSGLLPDYIQEIGRAARKAALHGYAALTYAKEDQRYSKVLQGISSIKAYQLTEVLKKIYRIYINNNMRRNMLVSVDDFGYIFDNTVDLDQKVMTALMMIEKDYLSKYRFNVLIARPKKMFVKVYARTDMVGYENLKRLHPKYFEVECSKNGYYTLKLNLDDIWKREFSEHSFPVIKHNFYEGHLFEEINVKLTPLIKITYALQKDYMSIQNELQVLFSSLNQCLANLQGRYFSEDDFKQQFDYQSSYKDKLVKYVLSTYSDRTANEDGFLQRRRGINMRNEFQVLNTNYRRCFATQQNRFTKMFGETDSTVIDRYASVGSNILTDYIRLGALLEIMELAEFESRGGDKPMVFVRLNDPLRIKRDSESKYTNSILEKTLKRHKTSSELFDHFFLHTMSDDERWNFIEDYFLGMANDELLEKYPGGVANHIDIIKFLERSVSENDYTKGAKKTDTQINIFPPRENGYYKREDRLTMGNRTLTIGKWITEDPVALDKAIIEHHIYLQEQYTVLQDRLQHEHFEYYRDKMGLNIRIDVPKFEGTPASVLYSNEPVLFYKWWKTNEEKVSMSLREKIMLFLKVEELKPNTLLKRHKKLIDKN